MQNSRCTRKQTVNKDIRITSGNSDGKVTQPVRIASGTIPTSSHFSETINKRHVDCRGDKS